MGSTGEPDRKRRHFSSISSPTAAMAKKQPLSHLSEGKKLDTAVLQHQNQKLQQKLEAQKVEHSALENKFSLLKEKQQPYNSTLKTVNKSWEVLMTDLETCSNRTREWINGEDVKHVPITKDWGSSSLEDAFLCRLMETGATESSSASNCPDQMEVDRETSFEKNNSILHNIAVTINGLWYLKDGLRAAVLKQLTEDDACRQTVSNELEAELKNLSDAKNKAELKHLKGELETTVAELNDSNCKLATLKAERNATKGAFFPVLNLGSKHAAGDKVRDKQKDLQEMESAVKELLDQASSRLVELKDLHEERLRILQKLSNLQHSLKSVKVISLSRACLLLRDQLEKSKSMVLHYRALFEKLQVEKDSLVWKERELNMKNDLVDVCRRSTAVVDSRIADLGKEIQKQINERNMIETNLEEASREPGRKDIIAEFKALVSSFPEEMCSMQSQLSNFKEASSDIHSLRADVQSLSAVLDMKAKQCESLSFRSSSQITEINKLQSVVQDLKDNKLELKLILDMYQRESTCSRDVLEARDLEYKAWAQVQSFKSSLDEQNLELRVKTANEAEAISQQKLAAAEAEIADLRQKLEASKMDLSRLSDVLKSKNEGNEAYLSEIETIGQAYDDMQTQNQRLLQQITERDDYNIKLVLEGVRARQHRDSLLMDKQSMEKEIQQANISLDFFNVKAARIEDQLKNCSDQVHKLAEDKFQRSFVLENTQKKLLDLRRSSNQARESLEDYQSRVEGSRAALLEVKIDLEKERFDKRRMEEELEVARRKVSHLQEHTEGSLIVEKLQQELREYREIVKCSICHDRPKEVICNPCSVICGI
ncbi:RING FINGER PROTEIN-RELATED [Salix koriyanagi]|uniref:E3 ubiquitin protein ligase n=1 Tax=Salix koriyanagi TaxID=2511006 RepID=A0A9Q0U3B5_9ROSI|nr:RING FINGER PROTEIN-RELATED [Salix koriyanagi]